VDDQLYFRVFLEDLLAQEGYEVETAGGGEEALARLESQRFDLVLTDLIMPGMDGAELVQRIKAKLPEQDVVIVTSVADVHTAVDAMKLGATDYLLKPIDKSALLRSVGALLQQRRVREEHARLMAENLEFMGVLSLYERAAGLFATLALEPLADRIAEALSLETGAQGACVWTLEDAGVLRLAAARGIVQPAEEPAELRLEALPPELAGLAAADGRCFDAPAGSSGPPPLVVPFVAGGALLGAARLTDRIGGEAFALRERAAAEKLGGFAATALANALRVRTLERRSFRDASTRAYSAAYFDDVVRNEIHKAHRFGRTFSLVRAELDAGTDARPRRGDAEQARSREGFARRLHRVLRSTDLLAVDEEGRFCVLLPETDALGAAILKRRLREAADPGAGEAGAGPEAARLVLASVTYPADGTQRETLLRRLDARGAEDRASVLRSLAAGRLPLPRLLERLAARAALRSPELPEQAARFLIDEIARRPHERGLLFLAPGPARAEALRDDLDALRGAAPRTEVVLVAERRAGTDLPVTWVAPARLGTQTPFLVYCGEGSAYALVEGPGAGGERVLFHSADRSLVEHLAFELGRDLGIALAA
jgi:FixJ family two-component response regulator/GGDEF domain-containing protein